MYVSHPTPIMSTRRDVTHVAWDIKAMLLHTSFVFLTYDWSCVFLLYTRLLGLTDI